MKNMFKKTLVAAAVAGMSTGAIAAELSTTTTWVANEWVQTADDEVLGKTLTIEVGANYTDNDIITLTFSGAAPATVPPQATAVAGNNSAMTLNRISYSDGVAIYRATNVGDDQTNGDTFEFPLTFAGATLSGNVGVSFSAQTAGTQLPLDDQGDNDTAVFFRTANQFNTLAGAGELNATIDVGSGRLKFADATGATLSSIDGDFAIRSATVSGTPVPFTQSTTVDSVEYTLTGDFGWLMDEDGEYDSSVLSVCGGAAFEATATEVVFSCGLNADVTFDVAENVEVMSRQTLGLSAEVNFTNLDSSESDSKVLSPITAGQWNLNGSEVRVPYMPYGANISQVLLVTNSSNQSGDITVTAFDESGNEYGPFVVGVSEAGTTKRITGEVYEGLIAEGFQPGGSTKRLALEIVTNAPDGQVTVYSAYNVGGTGARLVVNDSNGK